jgi:hypothetical protein
MKMPTTVTTATLAFSSLGNASLLETILFVLTAVLSPKEAKAHTDTVAPEGICETTLNLCKWSNSLKLRYYYDGTDVVLNKSSLLLKIFINLYNTPHCNYLQR